MRAWSLRSHLMALVLVTLVPVAVLSVVVAWGLVRHERRAIEDGLRQTTRALMIAVDRELQSSITALQALAESPALARGDLTTFRGEAEAARRSQAGWLTVIVADPSGQQRLNLLRRAGASLPPTLDRRTFDQVVATGKPVAGDVVVGHVTGGATYTVRVPVVRDGKVRAVLTAVIATDIMAAVLRAQRIPSDSVGSILDGRGYQVVRTRAPERFVARIAARDLIVAAARADEGAYRGWTVDGQEVYAAFSRSPDTRWTVAIGIPAAYVDASVRRALLAGLSAGVATLLAGIGLALLFGRRLARAIDGLSAAARALGRGLVPAPAPGLVHEVNEVARVIEAASLDRRLAEAERETLLERERAARQRAELAEAEHRALGAEAAAANRAKDDFLAVLSHELRTPLNAMFGWIRMLRRGGLDAAETARAIDTIERNTRLQAQIIQDLLDISSIVAGKVRLETRDVAVAAPLQAALDAAAPDAEARGVTLERAVELGDAVVTGDADRLQQVFGNLLSNALKFTPRGGRVTVTARAEGEGVAITVTDSGRGIAGDVLPHVFDRFRQADSSSTRQHGGLGLGLAIVRHLVEMHGGTVSAQSDGVGRGASFTIRLPMIATVPPPPVTRRDIDDRRAALKGLRVLVVDDEPDGAGMLAVALGSAGADVRTASSVEEALDLTRSVQFDAVLTDIAMPGRDGFELLGVLRESGVLPPGAPVIAVTAQAGAGDRDRALAGGFSAHVSKPVDPIALVDELAALVRRGPSVATPAP